eukprot:3024850-Alexandrium_andersonii.AAC.1
MDRPTDRCRPIGARRQEMMVCAVTPFGLHPLTTRTVRSTSHGSMSAPARDPSGTITGASTAIGRYG